MKKICILLLLSGILLMTSCNYPPTKKTGTESLNTYTTESTSDKTEGTLISSTNDESKAKSSVTAINESTEESSPAVITTDIKIAHTLLFSGDDVYNGNLLHITEMHPFNYDISNKLQSLYPNKNSYYKLARIDLHLQKDALSALNQMTKKLYTEKGFSDLLIFAARTVESAPDLSSDYASGLAVEFKIYKDGKVYLLTDANFTDIYNWLLDNCSNYGFIQRFPRGKQDITGKVDLSSFRYVGVPHAKYMAENNLCFEEYIAETYTHSIWKARIFDFNEDIYATYYVPAADSLTEIKIPTCDYYMISGDNIAGFIVTYVNPKDTEEDSETETEPPTSPETTEPETTPETTEPETTVQTETPPETSDETSDTEPEASTTDGDNKYYPRKYSEYVEAAAAKYDVPVYIIYSVIHTESAFDPNAVSRSGAMGLMQLMPDTFRWISDGMRFEYLPTEQAFNPAVNIDYGVWYLRYLYNYFSDWNSVFAAYNGGMGNVNKWLNDDKYSLDGELIVENIPFTETKKYVIRVNESIAIYTILYEVSDAPENGL